MKFVCKNFYCLRIIIYPSLLKMRGTDGKLIKSYDHPDWSPNARQLAQNLFDFRDKFLEEVFKKPKSFWVFNYGLQQDEVAKEFLSIWHNIEYCNYEGYYQYLIPIEYQNLITWMQQNKPSHSTEPSRFNISHFKWTKRTNFSFAEQALEFAKEMKEKFQHFPEVTGLTLADKYELN